MTATQEGYPLTPLAEARQLVDRAVQMVPRLTYFGMADPNMNEQDFQEEQAKLYAHLDEVAYATDFIRRYYRQKTPSFGSYHAKHCVEKWTRDLGTETYIANGSFCCAALGLGLTYKYEPTWGPNMAFGLARKALPGVVRGEHEVCHVNGGDEWERMEKREAKARVKAYWAAYRLYRKTGGPEPELPW